MIIRSAVLFCAFLLIAVMVQGQEFIPLYPDTIPNSRPNTVKEIMSGAEEHQLIYTHTTQPTLQVFTPPAGKANGTAVVIFPGGGYSFLAYQLEGSNVGAYLAEQGITAFVVKYRLPDDSTMRDKSFGPLQDAEQAMKIVRQQAPQRQLDLHKIGIMGFSAGGHLAASLGTRFKEVLIPNNEQVSLRPDFMVLVYPVISMTPALTHAGSRYQLLGANVSTEQENRFSNEKQVTEDTPPTYLTHTGDDKLVTVNNSIVFYQALISHHVPAAMHLYPYGDHGFVLHQQPSVWITPILDWMKQGGWL